MAVAFDSRATHMRHGQERPARLGQFAELSTSPDTTLDFVTTDEIMPQDYAFLVTADEFYQAFERIQQRQMPYWSDPRRRDADAINHWDDGRGVYFDDPDGHLLEIITRPYRSGGTDLENPQPLITHTITE